MMERMVERQVCEALGGLVSRLRDHPDDFVALVLADVLAEIDPAQDADVLAHAARFRARYPRGWQWHARELGIDRLLFHAADGSRIPALVRRAAEISEARRPGGDDSTVPAPGAIEASFVPPELDAAFHASGHLARIAVRIPVHHAELVLDEEPGRGWCELISTRGGVLTSVREVYDAGVLQTTVTTARGADVRREVAPWTRWVQSSIAQLVELTVEHPRWGAERRARLARRA